MLPPVTTFANVTCITTHHCEVNHVYKHPHGPSHIYIPYKKDHRITINVILHVIFKLVGVGIVPIL